MILGPNTIYQCSNCGNLLSRGSLISGNTFDAKYFSDGKMIAPMLPEFPDLTKCKKCNTNFWLSNLEEIGYCGIFYEENDNEAWEHADVVSFLDIDDYFKTLHCEMGAKKEDERATRILIWQAYNDRVRKDKAMFNNPQEEAKWTENCKRLLELLDTSTTEQKIITAEVYRNLCNFEKCIETIQSIDDEVFNWMKEQYIHACKNHNKALIELTQLKSNIFEIILNQNT